MSQDGAGHHPNGEQAGGPVLAAGAICWRRGDDGLELLLVLSARWGDWSWPKGKLDPGESLPECAVREVAEETGTRIELGPPLPSVSYVLPDGRDKTVHYWAARVRGTGPRTAAADEIEQIAWLPVAEALAHLTRPGDLAPVQALLETARRGRLETRPLLVVRHAKALGRSRWKGSEAERPLTRTGRRQATALAGLLGCWVPERVLSSPWARCLQTLAPAVDPSPDRRPERLPLPSVLPLLSEDGWRHDPGGVVALFAGLATGDRAVLVCTHRPVLAAAIEALAPVTDEAARDHLPSADPWLAPAQVLVAHVMAGPSTSSSSEPKVTRSILSVERYRGEYHRIDH